MLYKYQLIEEKVEYNIECIPGNDKIAKEVINAKLNSDLYKEINKHITKIEILEDVFDE